MPSEDEPGTFEVDGALSVREPEWVWPSSSVPTAVPDALLPVGPLDVPLQSGPVQQPGHVPGGVPAPLPEHGHGSLPEHVPGVVLDGSAFNPIAPAGLSTVSDDFSECAVDGPLDASGVNAEGDGTIDAAMNVVGDTKVPEGLLDWL